LLRDTSRKENREEVIKENNFESPRKVLEKEGWEQKVRAWRNLHESKASAMLRNVFLMLINSAPKHEILQEAYIRRVVWQKEIIFKEIKLRKINPTEVITIIQNMRNKLFK
jgi:hypothetical protein